MSNQRTPEEIADELKWLKDNKGRIVKVTAFGENNHDAIDAQIEVLNEGMSEEDCYSAGEDYGWSDRELGSAVGAAQWLAGDDSRQPSAQDNWGGLVVRK